MATLPNPSRWTNWSRHIRSPPTYLTASLIVSLGGLLNGLDTGSIGPITVMASFSTQFGHLSSTLHGLVISLLLLAATFVALIAGGVSDSIGRSRTIAIGGLIFTIGAGLEVGAVNLGMLIAGRLVVGAGEGMFLSALVVYICEIAPPSKRGPLTSTVQVLVTAGICIGFFICYGTVNLPSSLSWRIPFAFQAFISTILTLASYLFLPESPRWLALKGRKAEASAAWDRLGVSDTEREKDLLQAPPLTGMFETPERVEDIIKLGVWEKLKRDMREVGMVFRERRTRNPLLLGCFMMSIQQLSGIDGVLYYAPLLFQQAGISSSKATFFASGVSATCIFVFTLAAVVFVDKWGRRPTTIYGGLVLFSCMSLMGVLYATKSVHSTYGAARWVVIVSIYIFAISYAITWAISVKLLTSEIQPIASRAITTSLAQSSNCVFNFFVALITPILLSKSSSAIYFVFGACIMSGTIVSFLYMPETKGRDLETIGEGGLHKAGDLGKFWIIIHMLSTTVSVVFLRNRYLILKACTFHTVESRAYVMHFETRQPGSSSHLISFHSSQSTMPRKSGRQTVNTNVESDRTVPIADALPTPKRGRKPKIVDGTPVRSNKKVEDDEEDDGEEEDISLAGKVTLDNRRIKSVKAKAAGVVEKVKKATVKRKAKTEDSDDEEARDKKVTKKRKTKEEKEAESMPLAARTAIGTLNKAMHIGAHVSAAGGVQNSITNALHIGGNSFALFLKSQRKWTSPSLTAEARDQFKAFCQEHKYDAAKHVLPHGSYLVNLAQADPEKAEQAYTCFLDDLKRCEQLGIKLYNFHPGNTGPNPRSEAIGRIAAQLNKAHAATEMVVTVLENMAGSGNTIGSTWEDLRDIITLVDDKSRVGVCIDTCHSFAAGYDLRSPEIFKKTMDDFSSIVGISYLKALHLNDSKAPFSSHRDLHANIGTGFLGLRAFHNIMNFEPFQDLPMVLETPIDKKGADGKTVEDKGVWATEIKLLEGLIGADPETEAFKKEEQRLQDAGAEERRKFQGQVDKKQQKTLDSMFKKVSPKKKKSKKSKVEEVESDASEEDHSH
ncbi:hypothetical protein B7494_g2383 [Chlorociboria aeruginascens]|nr:hypothetical protein B7494_g2383 [Chlorociboria aeruginascens]